MLKYVMAAALLAVAATGTMAGPSFDCAKAAADDEKAICASPVLSDLDQRLADAYGTLRKALGDGVARKVQGPFLRQRHACGADEICLFQYGTAQLKSLAAVDDEFTRPGWQKLEGTLTYDALKAMMKPGDCTVTRVEEVTTRLCADTPGGACAPAPDSGSAIIMENGLYGVSYEREPEVERSQAGDVIIACLKSLPEDCPPGDDRGYIWSYENHRTGGKFWLPDSHHSCGGA